MNMKNLKCQISDYFLSLKNCIDSLNKENIETFFNKVLEVYDAGGNIFIMGNGGSGATASHFAGDMNKGVSYGMEKRLKVISLCDNMAIILAYANDISYDVVFEEQLKNHLKPTDLVIGISGSGNSKNIIKAIEYSNSKGAFTVGFCGYDGGQLKKIANLDITGEINDMQISEDIHMILCHLLMRLLNDYFANVNSCNKSNGIESCESDLDKNEFRGDSC